MKSTAAFWRRFWRGQAGWALAPLSLLLLPLELLFSLGVSLRAWRWRRRADRLPRNPIPVIAVGNLTVGGTGKTPVASWILEHVLARGGHPALVTRGYGRDEVMLHARWHPEVPIVVNRQRLQAVRDAACSGASVAVADDAFQHLALLRDLDVVLVAAEERFPGRLLPCGPYREPASALGRAGAVIVTRKSASAADGERLAARVGRYAPRAAVGRIHLAPTSWQSLDGSPSTAPTDAAFVVSSVGDPDSVEAAVADAGVAVVGGRAFPDHHEYSLSDIRSLLSAVGAHPMVTTEKDAVKLSAFADELQGVEVRVLRLQVVWEAGRAEIERAIDSALDRAQTARHDSGREAS